MQGKVCLVTGTNSGIGKETALGLAKLGATIVMVCRDRAKGEATKKEIAAQSGNPSVDLLVCDLSSQQAIRQLATEFKSKYSRLDVLINNAGFYLSNRATTVDGLEAQFAVNHLAYFLLTNLLLDVLKASAPSRVVNVASSAHADSLDFANLQSEKGYDGMQAYSRSKLANILFTYELARRLADSGVTVNCLHPGVIRSGLQRDMGLQFQIMSRSFGSPEKGAETSIYLASSPNVAGVSGKYFSDKRETRSSAITYDESVARKLWQVSAELTGLDSIPA